MLLKCNCNHCISHDKENTNALNTQIEAHRAQTYRSNFEIVHKLGLHVKAALNTSDLQIQFYPITELYMIKDKEPCGRQLGMKSILEDV